MPQWLFENIPESRAEVGFEIRFVVSNEGREFPHVWLITSAEPGRKLAYAWSYDGYPGDAFVDFELSQRGAETALKLKMTIRESLPDEIPEFRREICIAGGANLLKDRLRTFLEMPGR